MLYKSLSYWFHALTFPVIASEVIFIIIIICYYYSSCIGLSGRQNRHRVWHHTVIECHRLLSSQDLKHLCRQQFAVRHQSVVYSGPHHLVQDVVHWHCMDTPQPGSRHDLLLVELLTHLPLQHSVHYNLQPVLLVLRWGLVIVLLLGWLGGVVVSVSDSRSRGPGFDSQPVHRQATTLGKLLTPMCLCHQAVQFGTGQRAMMLCGREHNHRSDVALAMRHGL